MSPTNTPTDSDRLSRRGTRTARPTSVIERLDDTVFVEVSPNTNDVESGGGNDRGVREQHVKVRNASQQQAMGSIDRRMLKYMGAFQSVRKNIGADEPQAEAGPADEGKESGRDATSEFASAGGFQYRLESRQKITRGWRRFCCVQQASDFSEISGCPTCCCDFNKWINRGLHWTFRTSFVVLLLFMTALFIACTLAFAGLIMWSGKNNHECISSVAFEKWDDYNASDRFVDAYQLSWTTFSTVGYGIIYPTTSADVPDQKACTGIKFLCSLEAFVGILYSGLCGAILFGKVSRIQSFAQVLFSDPIVVRYGSGVAEDIDEGAFNFEEEMRAEQKKEDLEEGVQTRGDVWKPRNKNIQCPVLEFRIVNRLNNTPGGEIMDATLNCVASTDARNACPEVLKQISTSSGGRNTRSSKALRKRKAHRRHIQSKRSSGERRQSNDDSVEVKSLSMDTAKSSIASQTSSIDDNDDDHDYEASAGLQTSGVHRVMDEDSSILAPRRIFSKMEIQTDSHPFFKRVWLAKHVLDEHSPLLDSKVKKMILKNDGYWPPELNDHASIRDAIRFNQIIVSLAGTCNVNGMSVYAQKIYHFVDIIVGYKFANTLFRARDEGPLRVDLKLINDVQMQDGDDCGEPLEGEAIGESVV